MNEREFDLLFRLHLDPLTRYLMRRVPLDDVQTLISSTFEVAWRKRSQIPKEAELPWLYRIAALEVGNFRRKTSNRDRIFSRFVEAPTSPSAEAIAIADISLARAWALLPEPDRQILSLAAFEGLKPPELAVVIGISVNAATIRLHRARARLKAQLEE